MDDMEIKIRGCLRAIAHRAQRLGEHAGKLYNATRDNCYDGIEFEIVQIELMASDLKDHLNYWNENNLLKAVEEEKKKTLKDLL